MAKSKFRQIFFGRAALPIWLALATFGLTELFSRHPGVTEAFYSQTLCTTINFPGCSSGFSIAPENQIWSISPDYLANSDHLLCAFLLVLGI
jgi:hypothetical protein